MPERPATERRDDLLGDSLFYRLFDEAESVRWRIEDVPWHAIDRSKVSPGLLAFVREAAAAELTTFSATRRFLQEFADDADLSQWMSVWFYEETKHPHVLMRWLSHFGHTFDTDFVLRGRVTAPFMKSRFGTLVTNVISELVAASSYRELHRYSSEPVLSLVAKNLATDEARHAASFYAYARRMLERSSDPTALKRDGLKVLYMWFVENDRVQHPVNELHEREARRPNDDPEFELRLGIEQVRERAFRMIGRLLGLSIASADDIRAHMNALLESEGGESHAPS